MARNENDLTPLQQGFADAYLEMPQEKKSGAGAYRSIRPKAKDRVIEVQGSKMLNILEVKTYINKIEAELNERLKDTITVTRTEVINELGRVALSDTRKLFLENGSLKPITMLDDDIAAAVASVEVVTQRLGNGKDVEVEHTHKIKLHPKVTALDKLAQHFNIYEDHQKSGAGEVHVHIDDKDSQA